MIKFAHTEWETSLEIDCGHICTVVIERPDKFYQYIKELNDIFNGTGSGYIMSENGNELSFAGIAEFVPDVVNLCLNNKKTLSFLLKRLYKEITETKIQFELINALENLKNIINEFIEDSYIPLECSEESDMQSILKLFDIRFKENADDSLLEKIVGYIDIMVELKNIKAVVFLFLKAFLSEDSLTQLFKHCEYKNVSLILFENHYHGRIENEEALIIDKDLCEIVVKSNAEC